MRMHPGSVLPAHSHSRDEESLLLEGEAWVDGDTCLRAGDYQHVAAGLMHADMRSPGGCLVFVRSELSFNPRITPGLVARFIKFTVQRWLR
jgi:anti-sigma factor ChrR (cupin superfamily)